MSPAAVNTSEKLGFVYECGTPTLRDCPPTVEASLTDALAATTSCPVFSSHPKSSAMNRFTGDGEEVPPEGTQPQSWNSPVS